MGDDSEWMKLPAEEKVQHKAWKARLTGYEEVTKLFKQLDNEKSPEFSKYAGLMKKFVTDNNAIAQEKALDAVAAFVENAAMANRTCGEVVSGIVTKCLNSSRQKTKEKGVEIIMLYVEIEKSDIVQECLIEGLGNKQPKVVSACIMTIRMAIRDFGNKVFPIKPFMKSLPKLLEDRDKNVRDETKLLIIEIYHWIGAALKPMMTNFKPVQVSELEAEFEKVTGKGQQTRFTRSQGDLKAKMEERAASGATEGDQVDADEPAEEVDPYELMEAVDILALIPKDYYDKIEAKKWQERKEALEAVNRLTENPKIENGDYGQLVRSILKVVAKDTNVMLVALGGKCLAGLGKSLRKKYSPYAVNTIQTILEKFKEKKPAVVAALREAIDAAFQATTFDPIVEDLAAALDNKNPSIKAETAYFLARCFAKSTMSTLPKKLLKVFCASLLKTVNDTVPDVRERSFEALGTAMKVVTERHVAPYLVDVDPIKMQKITECCNTAVLLNARGEPRAGSAAAAAPAKGSEPKPVARPPKTETASKSTASRPGTAKSGRPTAKKSAGGAKGKDTKKKGQSGPAEVTENPLSDEAIEDKATELFTAQVLEQLKSSNWKERLAGMESLTKTIQALSKSEIPCQVCIRTVCKKPGLKDTNFQVLKLRVELVGHLGKNAVFSKLCAEICLGDLVDKIGDVKNGSSVQESISCIAEAVGLDFVSNQVLKLAFDQKNPKNQSESLAWLMTAIKEFGFKVNVKPMIVTIKKAFSATNPAIRNNAMALVALIHMYMGPQVRMLFEDEKPALLQQIDAEIEKVKGEKPQAPTRGIVAGEEEEEEEEDGGGGDEPQNVVDLIPRNDVGERFSPELIEQIADKNWKVRKESLEKVVAILQEAKCITGNLGPLPEAIKVRLGDSNKVLVTITLSICTTLANNMGPHCKHHIRTIGPALISCLGDSKPQLRAAAVASLNAWVEHCSLLPLVEVEAFTDALKLENPNLRIELLGWLSEKLPNHKQLPAEFKACVPYLLACLEDRNAEVRKKAQEALVPFMIHVGYETVFRATSKVKPASKDQIVAIVEKAKANVPAKPVKTKKVAQVKPTANQEYDELDAPAKQTSRPVSTASSEGVPESKPTKSLKSKAKSAPPTSKKKKEEEDTGPPMTVTVPKEQRFKDEKNMKVLKWNFIELRGEFVEQLRFQMEKNFSKSMMDLLFHNDFKSHTKAIEMLLKCLDSLHDETMCNLDMILKWFTIRFYDTNPSMLNKALEYLRQLFTMLARDEYHLAEYEATSFIPYLIIKVGENKDNVRRDVRNIFKLIYKVYPTSKMFTYLLDGLKSKNSKQRMECLEELGGLIEGYGITICQPTPAQALKLIAGQIGDRDNGVRNAALNTTVVAYLILGEGLYKYTGMLIDKDQSLLDERIKRSMKNKSAAPQKQEEPQRPHTAPQQPQRSNASAPRPSTATALPKSASSNSVKKGYAIVLEEDQTSQPEIPSLYQFDLEDIFVPVKVPTTINRARPPSPSMRMVSSDAATTISMVISQITNADITTCIQALAQIDEVLKDENRSEAMSNHVDQLLLSMSMQLKMVFSTHMESEFTRKDDVIRLYRCLLATLVALFERPNLAVKASADILKDLINSLVTILLDNRLSELGEGPQVVRSVNVLVVKIVEKSDHNSMISALIRLLHDCVSSATCSTRFLELIMKCLWKITRLFPDIINDINIDKLLLEAHIFLKAFPSHYWKSRTSDVPFRTIKTFLYSVCQLKGHKVFKHLTLIDASENSEIKSCLTKLLQHHSSSQNGSVDEEDSRSQRITPKPKRLTKSTHDMLAEIFKKVGSKENTKEGLNDLYDFKKKYPDADLEPFLKKSSQFFQNYIERGLKAIEEERDGKAPSSESNTGRFDGKSIMSNNQSSDDGTDANTYMERLRILRAKCGLDNISTATEPIQTEIPEPEPEITIQRTSPQETEPPQSLSSMKTSTSSTDVSELKMRLERIKKLAKS